MNKKQVKRALKLRKRVMKAVFAANNCLIDAHLSAQRAFTALPNARILIKTADMDRVNADRAIQRVKFDLPSYIDWSSGEVVVRQGNKLITARMDK